LCECYLEALDKHAFSILIDDAAAEFLALEGRELPQKGSGPGYDDFVNMSTITDSPHSTAESAEAPNRMLKQ
jgi:hypothetical protein